MKNLSKIFIKENSTIKEALNAIDTGAVKIALVLNSKYINVKKIKQASHQGKDQIQNLKILQTMNLFKLFQMKSYLRILKQIILMKYLF